MGALTRYEQLRKQLLRARAAGDHELAGKISEEMADLWGELGSKDRDRVDTSPGTPIPIDFNDPT